MTFDVVVIGAGPAGLAAATAAEAGLDVALVDAAPRPGGQYFRHHPADVPRGVFARLRDRLDRVTYLPGHRVWNVEPGFTVHAVTGDRDERPVEITARALIVATGAYDRSLPFPGWDLPGVLTAGGAQALLKGQRVIAGTRVVVAGSGPFLLPVATGLAAAGATVVGVFEAARPYGFARSLARHPDKLTEGAGYAAALARHGIPCRQGHAVVAAHGDEMVRAVTVARVDRDWRPVGRGRTVECDAVAVSYGFTPQLEIPLQLGCATRVDADGSLVVAVDAAQRTSVPGVYAAGETTGVGGAQLALIEGELAALSASSAVIMHFPLQRMHEHAGGWGSPSGVIMQFVNRAKQVHDHDIRGVRGLLVRRRRLRAFAAAMHAAYPVRPGWMEWSWDDTIVCRCEEVPRGALAAAVDLGATDPRAVKLLSRAGMGWCQGRVCGYATAALSAAATGREIDAEDLRALAHRPFAHPIRLSTLATPEPP